MADTPREQQTKGSWKKFRGRLQEAWGSLTGDELDKFEGRRDQLEGHLEKKTGEDREKIRRRLNELSRETDYRF